MRCQQVVHGRERQIPGSCSGAFLVRGSYEQARSMWKTAGFPLFSADHPRFAGSFDWLQQKP